MWRRVRGHVEFLWKCQDVDSTSMELDLWVFGTEEMFGPGVSLEEEGERGMRGDIKVGWTSLSR